MTGYKPNAELDDFDYDALSQTDIEAIAEETGLSEGEVRSELSYGVASDPEFDGFVIKTGGRAAYYEAKSGEVRTPDLQKNPSS
ncbi:hypothetical protein C475_08651 [Halosimplex carlsbadense 2-9-1]|uniref:Uncharacterized protein n=1 Tax=Halosimplex carlsbadense 2-9-1 TaxID=797114 RepID=M0CUU0_9EURY|nr:hypothetical protein [Halosimplex carlsbadense]ELZ26991.1 hypothetical protein C475_08651 [Halosimplex carlsbadense 2-9-1]